MIQYLRRSAFVPVLLSMFVIPRDVTSQTRFQWAPSTFDVSRYQYAEKCLAMVTRVNDSIESRTDEHPYTRNWRTFSPYHDYYESVRRAAAKCNADKSFPNWKISELLYRIAGMDDKAATVIDSGLARVSINEASTLAYALDTALWHFLAQRPVKLAQTYPLIDRYLTLDQLLPKARVAATLSLILSVADDNHDSVLLQRLFVKSESLFGSINVDTFPTGMKRAFRRLAVSTFEIQYRDSLLNALTRSVPAYNKMWGAYIRRVSPELCGEICEAGDRRVERLHARHWSPSQEDITQYPRKGKVTLLIGLPPTGWQRDEAIIAAHARRLKARFPEIDIIINYKTRGHFGPVEPPTVAQEAVLADSLWRKFYKVPALLLVEETPFWRLPDLDRRRVNERTENEILGSDMGHDLVNSHIYSIIDQNRDLVWIDNTFIYSTGYIKERDVERKIEALLRRDKK